MLPETKCLSNTAPNETQTDGKKWAECNVDPFRSSGSGTGQLKA